jgi:glycosyltransferase involved in cell wall biosynthesis
VLSQMKIIFLYSLLTPSVASVLRSLVANHCASIVFYYWDKGGNKPFSLPTIPGVEYRPVSTLSANEIASQVLSEAPDLIYVVAWQERKYLRACRLVLKAQVPVIAGFDDNYLGTWKQRFGLLMVRAFKHHYFSHAMVSGPRQYHYASMFGFADDQIIYYLFSADAARFSNASREAVNRALGTDRKFIFVGRYSAVKGIATLAAGYRIYRERLGGKYRLACFGSGKEEAKLRDIEGLEVNGYIDHDSLVEHCRNAVAFVLPSVYDPSPLVVHEMSLQGLPMVLSDNVGNRHMFLIGGFNGFIFRTDDPEDLARALAKIDQLSDEELANFGRNSLRLSVQHAPDLVAASLVSVVGRSFQQAARTGHIAQAFGTPQ